MFKKSNDCQRKFTFESVLDQRNLFSVKATESNLL